MNNLSIIDREKLVFERLREHNLFWIAVGLLAISGIFNFTSGYLGMSNPWAGIGMGTLYALTVILSVPVIRYVNWRSGLTTLFVVPLALVLYVLISQVSINATVDMFSLFRDREIVNRGVKNTSFARLEKQLAKKNRELGKIASVRSPSDVQADLDFELIKPIGKRGKTLNELTSGCTKKQGLWRVRKSCKTVNRLKKELTKARTAGRDEDRLTEEVVELERQMLNKGATKNVDARTTMIKRLRPDWAVSDIRLFYNFFWSVVIQIIFDAPWFLITAIVAREVHVELKHGRAVAPKERSWAGRFASSFWDRLAIWRRWGDRRAARLEKAARKKAVAAQREFGSFVEDAIDDKHQLINNIKQQMQTGYEASIAPLPLSMTAPVVPSPVAPGAASVPMQPGPVPSPLPVAFSAPLAPPVMKTESDRQRLNQLERFRAECLIMGGGAARVLPRDRVYRRYVEWARNLGQPAMLLADFARYMGLLLSKQLDVATGNYVYVNVSLRDGGDFQW